MIAGNPAATPELGAHSLTSVTVRSRLRARRISLAASFLPIAFLLVGACGRGATPDSISGQYPGVCRPLESQLNYSMRRCAAIVARAIDETGLDRSSITETDITWRDDHVARSGMSGTLSVRFQLGDGSILDHDVFCGGIMGAFDPACGNGAKIQLQPAIDYDVTCPGDPPTNCQTPPPTPPPDLAASATPLRIATLDIPIDHAGHYEIEIGHASLPAGYLSQIGLKVVDDQPTDFWVKSGGLRVRPDIAGRPPIGSRYRDPFDGLEPVTVLLSFEVNLYTAPGMLQLRDIVVR